MFDMHSHREGYFRVLDRCVSDSGREELLGVSMRVNVLEEWYSQATLVNN